MKIDVKKTRQRWIIYRLLYVVVIYAVLFLINYVTKTFHPINLLILLGICGIVFAALVTQDNKIFKGLEEFNAKNYEYVLTHQKEIIKSNFYSLEKLGGIVVTISAFRTKNDELFVSLINKIAITSQKMAELKVWQTYYLFMFSIIHNNNAKVEECYAELASSALPAIQKRAELLYKCFKSAITAEEMEELKREIDEERMLEYLNTRS